MNEFGVMIRRLRTDIGLSQYELADRCGIDQSLISRIENGAIWSDLMARLRDLSFGLGVPVQSMFDGMTDPQELALIRAYRRLADTDKASITRHAECLASATDMGKNA